MSTVNVRQAGDTVRFKVRVQPRASRAGVVGIHGDAIKVSVAAPPVDGKANEALEALLAGALGVARRAVCVVTGARGREKIVEVTGVTVEDVRRLVGER